MPARVIQDDLVIDAPSPVRVRQLIIHALKSDTRFNSSYEGLTLALRISESVAKTPLEIDEGDWEKLCEVIRNPQPMSGIPAYPVMPGHACVPMIGRVLNAERAKRTT